VATGDLIKKYPHIIEEHIGGLFQCLNSPRIAIRKVGLKLIIQLVLTDMIKVKQRITDVILMMNDPEVEVRNLVKLFFYELHRKDPEVYISINIDD